MSFFLWQSSSVPALAVAIVLGAFVSEDGATITAATLAASSVLDLRLAFLSAFAGLWAGDLGVYALAHRTGPAIRQHRWFKVWFAKTINEVLPSNQKEGQWSLALSRLLPGTRLPAYIAAGLGRLPVLTFAVTTAISAIVWIVLVFATIRLAPSRRAVANHHLGLLSLFGLALFALLSTWRRWTPQIRQRVSIVIQRVVKWEFWPAWLFYSPVALFCAYLGIRYRGFSLPTAANLNQRNGGIVGESKIEILQTLMATSPDLTSDGYLVSPGPLSARIEEILNICDRNEICFPFVLKPNTAQRGAGFKKVQSLKEAEQYLAQVSAPLVLQRYVAGPKEAGIFYYRFPAESKGHIFGITRKQFPVATGDGVRTLRELIMADSRARLIAPTYLERFAAEADRLLERGESVRLVEAGNHCQGCIFQDGRDLYTEELRAQFDEISQKLSGFFIGRFDIRYSSDDELRAAKSFQIIELNGAASEATNIYDECNSLWSAYATLYRQWKLAYQIGAANRSLGHRPASALGVLRDWAEFSRQAMEFPPAD
jgi:membrane protein DedA with SNARE-associated domain